MTNKAYNADIARHEEMLRELRERVGKVETFMFEVTELRAEIRSLKEDLKSVQRDIEELKELYERHNNLYKWVIGIMLAFSSSFLALVGVLIQYIVR